MNSIPSSPGDCRATELRIERIAEATAGYQQIEGELGPTELHLLEMLVFLLRATNGDGKDDEVHF